jgi:hypothetical protein
MNVNGTSVPCQADGRRYPIAGHLMAPPGQKLSDWLEARGY